MGGIEIPQRSDLPALRPIQGTRTSFSRYGHAIIALREWHFAAQRRRFTPSFGLRLPRRDGEEQIAGRRSLDPEVAPRNLDLLLLAPGEARRKRVCGVHTVGRARGGPR